MAALASLLTPQVTAFLPPSAQLDPYDGDAHAWRAAQSRDGAILSGIYAGSGLIGLVFVHITPDGAAMIGYLFSPASWGQGYASELLPALVAALGAQGVAQIYGGVAPENVASARVLEKTGFAPLPERTPDGSILYHLLWNEGEG